MLGSGGKADGRSEISRRTWFSSLSVQRNCPPDDPESLEKAADLADAAVRRMYPGHQYTLVAQKDGDGGLIHVHGTVNALHTETLKACRGRQTSYQALREEIEEEMRQAEIPIDYGEDHTKAETKRRKKRTLAKAGTDGYSWTEDLAGRIRTAPGFRHPALRIWKADWKNRV